MVIQDNVLAYGKYTLMLSEAMKHLVRNSLSNGLGEENHSLYCICKFYLSLGSSENKKVILKMSLSI